jgi:hypothetical protein
VKNKFGVLIFAFAVLFSACSTDLDVTGQWKETMVVYGLLDKGHTKQYIKINKAFLGQGNALDFAQVKDSVQFTNALNVTLKRIKNGVEIASYVLSPDSSIPKDPGIFYGPDQANAIYSYNASGVDSLNEDSEYKLVVKNNDSGKEVTSQTVLVGKSLMTSPNSGSAAPFQFIGPNDNYHFSLKFNSGTNGRIYDVVLRFHFIDSTLSGNKIDSLDWNLGEKRTTSLTGGEILDYGFRGQDFFEHVGISLQNVSITDLMARIPKNVDIILIGGADELATFIDVNAPSTGIIQEKPEYTNINGGLGIFSSRYNKPPFSRALHDISIDSLACGRYTKNLKFLNHVGILPGCP